MKELTRRDFLKLAALSPLGLLPPEREPHPRRTLGLYLPFRFLERETVMQTFQELVLTGGANTIVVDIKNEAGGVNVPVDHAYFPRKTFQPSSYRGLIKLLRWANDHQVSLIARQPVMIDPKLVLAFPELGIHNWSGRVWKDANDNPWANPFDERVVDYNATIAASAASLGFSQVQFDYVRFPSGEHDLASIYHTKKNTFENRTAAISAFFKAAKPAVNAYGAFLTADFFGYTAWYRHEQDMGIGQYIESAGPHLDGLCPMAYPSLYGSGIIDPCDNGCRPATAHPYEIVYYTVKRTLERLLAVNPDAFVQPWLQAYPDYRFKQPMGLSQFIAQQKGAFAAGATGVMAWNNSLDYYPESYQSTPNP